MYIWSFKINRSPYGRPIKYKFFLCAHGGMQIWGMNYWETYPPVVNWLYITSMISLIILRELHNKSVDFILAYTQAYFKL